MTLLRDLILLPFFITATDLKLVLHISSSQYVLPSTRPRIISIHEIDESRFLFLLSRKSLKKKRRIHESFTISISRLNFRLSFPEISHDENHLLPFLLPSPHLKERRIHESFTVRFPGKKNTEFPPKARNQTLTRGMRRLFPFAYKDVTPPIAPRCPFLVRPYHHPPSYSLNAPT